jgi:hypothetical protein
MNLNNFSNLFKEADKVSKSLRSSVGKAGLAIAQGKPIVAQKDKAKERLDICSKCKDLDKILGRCNLCGCFVSAKARADYESCPSGKW